MKRIFINACVAALLPVIAQADTGAVLSKAQASRVMYESGLEARDPLMVVAAAKLRRSLGLEPASRSAENAPATQGDFLGWQAMLSAARDLSEGDDLMLGLIEDVEAEQTKGIVYGPVYNIGQLSAKTSDTYRDLPLEGAEYAEFYVEAKGNSDLNIFVYDEKDRLACSDTDASAIAYCGFRPRATANFTIKITNASSQDTQYSLITN